LEGPDEDSPSLATNWIVESKSFSQEYQDYGRAISDFNNISNDGKHVILFEIKRKYSDGSIVKKTPLLNSEKTKLTSFKHRNTRIKSWNLQRGRSRFENLKLRILILAIVLIVFLIMIYIFNIITTGPSGSSISHHFILTEMNSQYSDSYATLNYPDLIVKLQLHSSLQ
jgi:hypothetical protein